MYVDYLDHFPPCLRNEECHQHKYYINIVFIVYLVLFYYLSRGGYVFTSVHLMVGRIMQYVWKGFPQNLDGRWVSIDCINFWCRYVLTDGSRNVFSLSLIL